MHNLAYMSEDTLAPATLPLGLMVSPVAAERAKNIVQRVHPAEKFNQGNCALVSTNALHIYPLSNGINTIGRDRDCRIRLADPVVSRLHAKIVVNGNALILSDAESTNGTFVNGKRINCTTILRGGDRVKLGSVEFVVAG